MRGRLYRLTATTETGEEVELTLLVRRGRVEVFMGLRGIRQATVAPVDAYLRRV